MKAIITLLLLVMLASCYRAHNEPRPDVSPQYSILVNYRNSSIKDSIITYSVYDSTQLVIDLNFNLLSGNPENYPISCSISNLPKGITVQEDSFTFKLNMEIGFALTVNADTGLYTVNINVRTPDGLQTYPVRIHATPVQNCAPTLAGTYTGGDPGTSPTGTLWHDYTSTVASIPGYPHLISITNIHGLGDSLAVTAYINCDRTFDIPYQTVKGYTIFGRGKGHWEDSGELHSYGDTVIYSGDTTVWWAQLKR